jgi:hypothetical protein
MIDHADKSWLNPPPPKTCWIEILLAGVAGFILALLMVSGIPTN